MKDFLELIDDDVFGIARRLKQIDEGYVLFFNKKANRYEVHNTFNIGNSLSFVSPYQTLDKRLLDLARKSRSERKYQIIKEMEVHNAKIEDDEKRKSLSDLRDIMVDLKKYLKGED